MSKIPIIIRREYVTRIRKKSFILMTLFIPLLLLAAKSIPAWLYPMDEAAISNVAVIDQTGKYLPLFQSNENYTFNIIDNPENPARKEGGYDAYLIITGDLCNDPDEIAVCSNRTVSKEFMHYVAGLLNPFIENEKLEKYAITLPKEALEDIKTGVRIQVVQWDDDDQKSATSYEPALTVGMAATFLIYFLIVLYGSQVMRSVVEEKTTRIVEIIITSVKPFELMMGKMVGVALVGLTQFLIWILFAAGFFIVSGNPFPVELTAIPHFTATAGFFVLYFLGGYFLYASLFAATGAASDNDTDTQQFMLPLTLPVVFALFAAIYSAGEPDGSVAFWCSVIPFTSPVVMMVRIPFGVPAWELALSFGVLAASFIFSIWIASKIYHHAILMYGKKSRH